MAELFEKHERCPSCKYWADVSEWSELDIDVSGCKEYSPEERKPYHWGGIELIACPECKTIIWHRPINIVYPG